MTSIAALYSEELKATMRGRFAWLGAGVVLLIIGAFATLCTQGGWLQAYGIIAYGLVPLAFVPIAAAAMASPRANRFVECVFTAPVSRRDWLAAKFLVLFTLAAAYYAALLPAMFVYAAHVGVPLLLHKYLLWTPGILLAEISIGSLIGILFIGRSVLAPIGTAMGLLLAYVIFIPMQEVMVAQGNGATRSGHITLSSPAVLLKNALGFAFGAPRILSETRMTWISLAILVFGSLLLTAWVFLRAQGVETWEATRPKRWVIVLAIVVIALFPSIFAETTYDTPAPPTNNGPQQRLSFPQGAWAALVRPGAQVPRNCCRSILNWDYGRLTTDHPNHVDLLLVLPVDPAKAVTDFHAMLRGEGLEISADSAALNQPAPPLTPFAYPNDSGPLMPDAHKLTSGSVVRIPITLDPRHPWDLGNNRFPLNIVSTFKVAGDAQPHAFEEHAAVFAQVGAMAQMALAALILPLCCFGAAFARWRRTR
jgi:ABC-type transport system involved in multi-copper enzyme maturation permease subunit